MAKYIKSFVEGYGVSFERNKKNPEIYSKAMEKWAQIYANLDINENSVLMFCGAKNNGKSNLIRYVVNNYNDRLTPSATSETSRNPAQTSNTNNQHLDKNSFVYYVDFDPGQPEMTTPGCVSAHLIRPTDQPLVSPTYLNLLQHEPIMICSVGGINMSVNPHMYIRNCRYVFEQVKDHQSKQTVKRPIFINTMGHIRNVGLSMIADLIKSCKPTNITVLNIESDYLRTIQADLSPATISSTRAAFYQEIKEPVINYRLDLHNLDFAFNDSQAIATKNRTAQQIAYFGHIPDALYKTIMQLDTKWLSLKTISVNCISSYPLRESIIMNLLYNSWIHLGKLINPQFTICHVLGCAIVAHVDFDQKKIAIITPLSQEVLDQQVDCLIKPLSIQIPTEILQASTSMNRC